MKLSVVTGTLNRLPYLKKCIESIQKSVEQSVPWIDYEIIIVDGGSTDGTDEWLQKHNWHGVKRSLIYQGKPLGAVAAFNAGFSAAHGEYVAAINDDAEYVGDTLVEACKQLDENPKAGQIAIPFCAPGGVPMTQILPNWMVHRLGKKDLVYANFSVTRKSLGDKVGWWGDFYHYAGDTRLSIEIWLAGYEVQIAKKGSIIHHALDDDTRKPNIESERLQMLYDPGYAWRAMSKEPAENRGTALGKQHLVRIRYLGQFHAPATYSGLPSGKVYHVKLKPRAEFYVLAGDLETFLAMRADNAQIAFETV